MPTKAKPNSAVKKKLTVSNYSALENIQREKATDLKFYLFHAPAAEIYQWGLINRLGPDSPKGIQRGLNKTKVRRIGEYLGAFDVNTIATSVIVVFNKESVKFRSTKKPSEGVGELDVSWSPGKPAGVIVDGQHRVIGAANFDGGGIHLNVVGIVGADSTEGAFQFLVINNNSSKVSPNHVKALFTDYKEEALLERMLNSGSTNIDEQKITALDYFDRGIDSPFKGEIKWAKNKAGFIVANALEAGLSEVENRAALLSIQDLVLDTFTGIWGVIKQEWTHLWNAKSHLLEKACLQAVTAFIADSLVQLRLFNDDNVDYSDPDVLSQRVSQILKKLDTNFFEVEWSTTGLDTRAGQEMLIADLKQMASNAKSSIPWHHRLETVSIAATSDSELKKGGRPRKRKE